MWVGKQVERMSDLSCKDVFFVCISLTHTQSLLNVVFILRPVDTTYQLFNAHFIDFTVLLTNVVELPKEI